MTLPYDEITQEYVKVIYNLENEQRVARVTDIAEKRGVTKSSVSLVLNQLQKKELIDRKQYGHITLTTSGRRLGSTLSQRHQVIKRFLMVVLGVSEATADNDACKMEHDLSQESWDEIERFVTVLQNCPRPLQKQLDTLLDCARYANEKTDCDTCTLTEQEHDDSGQSKDESGGGDSRY